MSDTYKIMSRDEVMQTYGFDPEPVATDANIVNKDDPYIKNHLKSLAVGAATIPTDLIALPGHIKSGVAALYRSYANDTGFLDEFSKDLMSEGATERIQQHIGQIQQAWQQQNPGVTKEQLDYATDEYMKSKQFEDFRTSQMSGTAWLQNKWRDTVRRTLGDERPESERSWTESAAEVVGGALVPGPTGWAGKVGSAAAKRGGLVADVAGSTLGRGTLKTAEVLTPLTMPYSPANVAVNAGVGVALDQGLRYAQGQSTAFTPTPEDQAGVGTLSAGAAAVVGGAAFIAAIKGRTNAVLNAAGAAGKQQPPSVKPGSALDEALVDPQQQGAASMTGGDPNTILPRSHVESLTEEETIAQLGREHLFDKGSMIDASIRRMHGREAAREAERVRNDMSNAVTNETSFQLANEQLDNLNAMLRNMPPEDARDFIGGWLSHSMDAHSWYIMNSLQDEINGFKARLEAPNVTQREIDSVTPRLEKVEANLKRMLDDDPAVRVGTPTVPMKEKAQAARRWEKNQSPHYVQMREEIKRVNKRNLDELVASHTLSRKDAAELFARNPYFAPLVDDPFHGKTGWSRVWAQGVAAVRGKPHKATYSSMYNDPIRKLKDDLFDETVSGSERRVISPMHPLSALQKYTQRLYKNKAHVLGSNKLIKMLTQNSDGTPTKFALDKKILIYENPNAKGDSRIAWIEPHQLHHKWVQEAITKPGVVRQMENGRMRLWELADHELASVLRNDPINASALSNFAGAAMNFFKFFTTGRGNFAFAFKGPLYDTPIMLLTRAHDRVFGPVTNLMAKYAPNFTYKYGRIIPDFSAYFALPWHAIGTFIETQTWRMSKYLGQQLSSQHSAFRALEQAIGKQAYEKLLQRVLKIASWAEEAPTQVLRRKGGMRTAHSIDNIDTVRDIFAAAKEQVPVPLRGMWQFYTDVIDSFYGANKRQYFVQNYARMHQKYNGRVPEHIVDRLANEARNAAGDMTKTPGADWVRGGERIVPYLTQSKLGAYYLYRNMAGPDTYHYMLPRLSLAMSAVAASYWWRTYWNEESRNNLWNETPAHELWRGISIPSIPLAIAHLRGEKVPYNRELYYNLTMPPDLVPIIAGTVGMAQALGWIPSDATPKPILSEMPNFVIDSLTPAMPPLWQALAAQSNMKLDPQSSETRGGNWIREFGSNFRAGPQAEAFSNLGQVTNSQALFLNAMFGAMGTHIAVATDIALHAAKYRSEFGPAGQVLPRESAQFGRGLALATDSVVKGVVSKIPDIPFMWRGHEKRSVSTPHWTYVRESDQHIRSITGMRDHMQSKTEGVRREDIIANKGIPSPVLNDVVLARIANDIAAYQRPTGDLGILRKQYRDLMVRSRGVSAQYNLPSDDKRARLNDIVRLQQENLVQQQMAIKYAEQKIAELYGDALAPRLNGRNITMKTLDQMMRESMGNTASQQSPQ